ncbi:MAG TPA: RlmE family RNA methyltransferase [bacterium]|nr:MAG: Ribosomal RNA large subunit methyltransferase E [bacterium ADurb.Bin270]HPW45203.1 RlmE family RNA methyltransferase [bacterium]
MGYERKDHFYKKAKREGKASRAAYKLFELQKRFALIRKGGTVIELGSAPGGWMQELSAMVGPKGKVVGIDILPLKIQVPKNCTFFLGDIAEKKLLMEILAKSGDKADAVVSDMAPNISGVAFADAYRSYELANLAFESCAHLLKQDGNFLAKIFPGDEFEGFVKKLKMNFKTVRVVVPEATRKTSSERYIVCIGYKNEK